MTTTDKATLAAQARQLADNLTRWDATSPEVKFVRPTGMATNGGCRCWEGLRSVASRLGALHRETPGAQEPEPAEEEEEEG